MQSIKLPGIYALLGFLWILFSDKLIILITHDVDSLVHIQTYKGWFFIIATAILLYLLLRRTLIARQYIEISLRNSEKHLSATLSSIGDGVISADIHCRIVSINRAAKNLTGWNCSDALGRSVQGIFPIINAQTRKEVENPVELCLREDRAMELANHTLLITRDGTERHIAGSCSPIHDTAGKIIGTVLVFRDETKEYRYRQQLDEERERLANVVWGTGVGTWEWNVQTGETRFNERWAEIIGHSLEGLFPVSIKTWEKFLHPEDQKSSMEALEQHYQGETEYYECECRMRHQAGHWVWILDRGKVVSWTKDGKPLWMAGIHLDITDRKREETIRRLSDERLESIFRVAPIGIGMVRERVICEVNQRFCEMIGYSVEELIGKSARILYPTQKDYDVAGETKYAQIESFGTGVVETRLLRKDGSFIDIQLSSAALNPNDFSQGVTFTALDITQQKKDQDKIAYLAHHDQLTGLANRFLFAEHFELAAGHALRTKTKLALCVLDLDSFKAINDSHGHPQGDQLLCEVAKRLKNAVRSSDTVCRIGGDEFLILFTDLPKSDAVTALIQNIQDCFEPRFNVEGVPHLISASMGVAIFPEDGNQFSILFEHADSAMYYAKESGRNRAQFFRREISERIQHHLTVEKELRQALLSDQLELYYQPIVQLPAQRMVGMEALVRWRHPQKGLLGPDYFIAVAEESNLIVVLGEWVLKTACRDIAAWRKMGLPPLPVSVNISANHLFEEDFAALIGQIIADNNLSPQQLELEVTENIFLESSDTVENAMKSLKDIGVGLSLDDFGTGYSSLSYLKRFRIEKLKIDRSFMEHVCHVQQDAVLVRTIIRMAKSLGMQVVSEGVETNSQLKFLVDEGCELAQGFFFSKPLPLDAIQEMLNRPEVCGLDYSKTNFRPRSS
jgi:diguanylate cyclase (GGDEF)-like protein/PAS domain S-box-containing protein